MFSPLTSRRKLPDSRVLVAQRKAAKHDLLYFARHILGYSLIEESVHRQLCNILSFQDAEYTSKKKLVLLPRDTFKSTIGTVALPIHLLTRYPDLSILIHCEVVAMARAFLSEIKARIEDPSFKLLYGNWIPSRNDSHRYTENLIDILPRTRRSKEGSIACSGVDKSITGSHYDFIICDDLVGETNHVTSDQLEKTIRNFSLISESILKKNGILLVIGTRWDDRDVYGSILETNAHTKEWDIIIRPAVSTRDNPEIVEWPPKDTSRFFFPSRLDEKTLLRKQENFKDDQLFFSQYLLDPAPKGSSVFNREWIRFYNNLPQEKLNFFITGDPSTATKHGDFSALMVVAVDTYSRWHIVELIRDKLDPSQFIETLFDLNERFKPLSVGIESVSFQITLLHFIEKEQISRKQFIPIVQLKTSTQVSKEQRIRALIPYFKQGQIFLPNPPTPAIERLVQELVRFPKGAHDDCIDALAYIPQLVTPPPATISNPVEKKFHERMWDLLSGREKPKSEMKGDPVWMN